MTTTDVISPDLKTVLRRLKLSRMGHEKVDMSVNVYAQSVDDAKRSAAATVSGQLFTIVHAGQGAQEPTL